MYSTQIKPNAERIFLAWFEEVEIYFYQRVEEVKQML